MLFNYVEYDKQFLLVIKSLYFSVYKKFALFFLWSYLQILKYKMPKRVYLTDTNYYRFFSFTYYVVVYNLRLIV